MGGCSWWKFWEFHLLNWNRNRRNRRNDQEHCRNRTHIAHCKSRGLSAGTYAFHIGKCLILSCGICKAYMPYLRLLKLVGIRLHQKKVADEAQLLLCLWLKNVRSTFPIKYREHCVFMHNNRIFSPRQAKSPAPSSIILNCKTKAILAKCWK